MCRRSSLQPPRVASPRASTPGFIDSQPPLEHVRYSSGKRVKGDAQTDGKLKKKKKKK